jgi:hypothetical protein
MKKIDEMTEKELDDFIHQAAALRKGAYVRLFHINEPDDSFDARVSARERRPWPS